MRLFTSGLPSVSLCSSFTSWWVMRIFWVWLQIWNGTSTRAIRISEADRIRKVPKKMSAALPRAGPRARPARSRKPSRWA